MVATPIRPRRSRFVPSLPGYNGPQEQSIAQSSLIYIGIAGTVVALDRATGAEVWRSDLKGNDFVNVALQDGDLYALSLIHI